VRLSASGAPAAVKRRALEPVNKVKILPLYVAVSSPEYNIKITNRSFEIVAWFKYLGRQ
jgi:hypothetical protein